jgi:drug/metabolite transporter (DMT)-like permease
MFYLALAIICSASIALIFKHSETRGLNRYAVTSANYLVAWIVSLSIVILSGISFPPAHFIPGALNHICTTLLGPGATFTGETSVVWAMLLGVVAGLIFFPGFIFYQMSIREHGVSLTGAFSKVSILIPMGLSLVLWQDFPTRLQWIGITLALFSIGLVHWPTRNRASFAISASLLLLFLFFGIAEFSNKVFQHSGELQHRSVFLFTTFLVAFLFGLLATILKKRPVTWRDFLIGAAVGIPNLFSSYFLISALDLMPAAVVFPVYGAGTILIINLVGVTFFRERPGYREQLAIMLILLAVVLINL